jgi:hypothetical protein
LQLFSSSQRSCERRLVLRHWCPRSRRQACRASCSRSKNSVFMPLLSDSVSDVQPNIYELLAICEAFSGSFLRPGAIWSCADGTGSAIEKNEMTQSGPYARRHLPEPPGKRISTALGEVARKHPRKLARARKYDLSFEQSRGHFLSS